MISWIKENKHHFIIFGLFLIVCFLYFTPAFQGKVLGQSDVMGAQSTQTEINSYKAKDTTILWTNQIFGGMPAFQIWAPYPNNITTWVVRVITTVFPNPLYNVLLLFSGSYFLFNVLKLNAWLAAAGSVAFTFSSYNIILLVAGHTNQVFAIAFFAPLLASILLTLRGKYWLGGALTALFLAMEIRANHVQMTYYFLIATLILICVELFYAMKNNLTKMFFKSILYLIASVLVALVVNASLLWSTYEFGKETIRGQSNLTQESKEPSNGLDRTYAYQYSQGVTESFTFLVPNASGGGSVSQTPDPDSEAVKIFLSKGATEEQAINAVQQISSFPGLSMYWGDKRPSTYGPYYFGAVICFLFVLGLLIVKDPIKWWLSGIVILTLLLSFGGNWPYLSDLFFNYFPLYNKFRAVESILAVTGLCFPVLALLAVQEIIESKDKAWLWKKLKIALYITGGLSLILIIVPELLLSFIPHDQHTGVTALTQAMKGDSETANSIANALIKDRKSLEQSDAIRSLVFILLAFGVLWAYLKQKIQVTFLSVAFCAIILIDLWQIDKRYLANENFQDKKESLQPQMREVDQVITRDRDPNYRVVDLTQSPKYDLSTPFFHKSIWGYSAARLKRFDELIDRQFSSSINTDVLDMLNAKYLIVADPKTQVLSVQPNETTCGHAWFVHDIKYVKNADEEMNSITRFSPKSLAIIDEHYRSFVGKHFAEDSTAATISLTHYNPDHLIYQTSTKSPQVAVFSEIYYDKGWKLFIDKKEMPFFRADYLLRAACVPSGQHTLEFIFRPTSYYVGEYISLGGSLILIIALFASIAIERNKLKAV